MFNCWIDILCGKILWILSLRGWLAAEAVLLQNLCSIAGWTFYAVKYTGLYRWVGGWQAGEAVLLQTLCSIAGWTFNAVKYTGLYRWVGGWQLRLCFYKPYAMLCYVQLLGGHFMR